jgi:uncharacterized coiled-coil DUF342 family protein
VSCTPNVTFNLTTSLVNEHKVLDGLNEQRRDLAAKRANSTDDDEKKKLSDQLDALDQQIEASQHRIEALINKCIDYRTAVNNVFRDAFDKVKAETDAAIKPYADQLADLYNQSIASHQSTIDDYDKAVKICKRERP